MHARHVRPVCTCMWYMCGCGAAAAACVQPCGERQMLARAPGDRAMRMGMRCVGLCCRACANGALAVWGDGAMRRSGDWAAGGASGRRASTHP